MESNFKDFTDHCMLRHDTEVLASLDKGKEGTLILIPRPFSPSLLRARHLLLQSAEI